MPATSGVPDSSGTPAGTAQPGARWRRVFPGEQYQLAVLRRWLHSLLPDCASRGDIVSIATELGTNAVLHTATGHGGWFAVEVTWYGPIMRVAVADCGGTREPRVIRNPDGEHGRGLALVQGLAVRTGFLGDYHGRVVWADVSWGESCRQAQLPTAGAYSATWTTHGYRPAASLSA